ncbi:MAG TPA: hypothetical protein P5060_02945 [Candidatus Absconditabacterales bacterium]|nr:hypothetical protein [Candidatus Absconditabacterales bacterium]
MFKKLLLGLGIAGFLGLGSVAIVNAQNFNQGGFGTTVDAGGIAGVTDAAGTSKEGGLITVIKKAINWILGLLSLIVLVLLLYGGFKMITAAGDETKYKEGFKILKQAGIGLAVVGLSWFIVSIIFWIIGGTTQGV